LTSKGVQEPGDRRSEAGKKKVSKPDGHTPGAATDSKGGAVVAAMVHGSKKGGGIVEEDGRGKKRPWQRRLEQRRKNGEE